MADPVLEVLAEVAKDYGVSYEVLPDGSVMMWMPKIKPKKCPTCKRYL
jgi:hypothetical protein